MKYKLKWIKRLFWRNPWLAKGMKICIIRKPKIYLWLYNIRLKCLDMSVMNRIKENCFFIFEFFISNFSHSLVKFLVLNRLISNNYKILKEISKQISEKRKTLFPFLDKFYYKHCFYLVPYILRRSTTPFFVLFSQTFNECSASFRSLSRLVMLTVELLIFCFRHCISFAWIVCFRSQLDRKLFRCLKGNIE